MVLKKYFFISKEKLNKYEDDYNIAVNTIAEVATDTILLNSNIVNRTMTENNINGTTTLFETVGKNLEDLWDQVRTEVENNTITV